MSFFGARVIRFRAKGEVDPDFLRSRLNILVIEYPEGEHEHVTKRLNSLAEAVEKGLKGFDLRSMYSESDVSSIPTSGTNLVIVADVKGVLYFRIFGADGKVVVDTDETRLTTQAGPIADLKRQLDSVRPPHKLTRSEKDRVVTAVTSIVGHTRLKPASLGFSFRMPAFLKATPDVPDLLLVRGTLPSPGPGECVGISCGRVTRSDRAIKKKRTNKRKGDRTIPIPGGDASRNGWKFLHDRGLKSEAFDWIDADKTLGIFRRPPKILIDPRSPFYGLVARTVETADPDLKDLRLIPEVCQRFLTEAAKRGFVTARLMIIAGGPSAPFPPLHAVIQMARGIRDWFGTNPQANLRVVVHLVDPGVWFNIQSGRLNLLELLANETVQAVVLVQNPDGTASRQYRLVGRATASLFPEFSEVFYSY